MFEMKGGNLIDRGYEWYEERREGYANGKEYPLSELYEVKNASSTLSWQDIGRRRDKNLRMQRLAHYRDELLNTTTMEQKLDLLIRITIDGLS